MEKHYLWWLKGNSFFVQLKWAEEMSISKRRRCSFVSRMLKNWRIMRAKKELGKLPRTTPRSIGEVKEIFILGEQQGGLQNKNKG